jgi:hypothetical protein
MCAPPVWEENEIDIEKLKQKLLWKIFTIEQALIFSENLIANVMRLL